MTATLATPAGSLALPAFLPDATRGTLRTVPTHLVAGVTPIGDPVEPFLARVPQGGNTVAIPAGGTEWAVNVGDETYHEILIELKRT